MLKITNETVKPYNSKIKEKKYEILDVNDNCTFRINIDVLNEAFGAGRSMYAKASYPDKKHTYFTNTQTGDQFFVWMPKMYGNSSEWKNSLSDDGEYIYEIAEPPKKEDWNTPANPLTNKYRIVFAKQSPKAPYKFVGVFKDEEMNHLQHKYRRVAEKIKLIGNPVTNIEILK